MESTTTDSYTNQTACDEAIESMCLTDKVAYIKAKKTAPDLVLKESNPSWFLRYEKNNPWAAAKRLALYWQERVKIFGPNRAYLPLDTTGEGALSKETIEYHFTGFVSRLPNDSQGRAVILHDPARKIRCEMKFRLEHSFYLFALVSQSNENFVEKGIVSIYLLRNIMSSMDGNASDVIRLGKIFPLFFHKMHFVPVERTNSILDVVVPFMLRIVGPFFLNDNVAVHRSGSLLKELEADGLFKDGLPDSIGGTWTFEKHHANWLEQQIRLEWGLPLMSGHVCSSHKMYHAKRLSELTDSEKAERRRRYNVINSRRRRNRDKAEYETMMEQVQHLELTNLDIRQENQRLESLLQQCSSILDFSKSESAYNARQSIHNHGVDRAIGTEEDRNGDKQFQTRYDNNFICAPDSASIALEAINMQLGIRATEQLLSTPETSLDQVQMGEDNRSFFPALSPTYEPWESLASFRNHHTGSTSAANSQSYATGIEEAFWGQKRAAEAQPVATKRGRVSIHLSEENTISLPHLVTTQYETPLLPIHCLQALNPAVVAPQPPSPFAGLVSLDLEMMDPRHNQTASLWNQNPLLSTATTGISELLQHQGLGQLTQHPLLQQPGVGDLSELYMQQELLRLLNTARERNHNASLQEYLDTSALRQILLSQQYLQQQQRPPDP